jgi:hypothetical protein
MWRCAMADADIQYRAERRASARPIRLPATMITEVPQWAVKATRTWRRYSLISVAIRPTAPAAETWGFVARPWALVATLLAVGAAGATWGECGATGGGLAVGRATGVIPSGSSGIEAVAARRGRPL